MKRTLIAAFSGLLCTGLYAQVEQVQEYGPGISRRLQHEIDMTMDPALGYVPKDRLVTAYEMRRSRIQQLQSQNRATLLSWTERGPNSDAVGPSNGNPRPGNGVTSGRMRAIWEDLGDATGKTVWVGGIDGGLWKTNDITVSPANWTPINDFFGNLAVSSICQDPTDVNIMYFGTGEKAINSDAVRGAGLWMSTDHGVNWAPMPGTQNFWNVSKVLCDAGGNLYVACNSISNTAGLQRYTKATGTWTNITPAGLDPRVPDMEISSTGRLHIVCGYYNTAAASAGYRYTDNPATVTSAGWTSATTSFTPVNVNVDLACNGNTLYALPSSTAFEVPTIYKSTNGGATWAATTTTPAFTSGQGWYCMGVAIDPNNANNVIVGSLDCYKSTNGGGSWTKISNWVGTTGQYVHADQQIITWRSNNQVLVGSDGGIFYSANGGTTFADRNIGLRIKQFYSVAINPTSTNYFLAGAQDNGVHQLNSPGLGASVEVTGGDGAFVHIDQNQPQFQWGSYVYNQYRRSTNSGGSWTSVNFSSTAGQFINPTDYDDVNNIMYCSGNAGTFVRWSNPQSGATFTSVTMSGIGTGKVTALKVSPYTNHTVYFAGGGSGVAPTLLKATAANATPAFTSILGAGMNTTSARISCIELGTSEQNIIVVYSNYGVNNVWVTSDGGTTWSAIDGNLPDMPVRWAMFYPGDNTKAIIATETGIWQTELINGASTVWDPETGFPNVRTDMLQYRSSDGLIAAATHGRGLFTAFLNAAPPSCGTVTGLASSAVTASAATVSWSALSGALNYDVDYKLNSSATWINAATATTVLSVNLSGLTASSLYDFRVRANCTGISGAYTQSQFTTTAPAACGTPTGLSSSGITTSAATVSWTAVSGATSYLVEYKANSSATWLSFGNTNTTSVTISGLAASTLYDWRVTATCASGNSTPAQAQFTTATAVTCPGPLDVSTNGTAAGAASIPLNTDVKGLISPSGDNDYYRFVITTGGTATITLTTLPADYDIRLYSSDGTTQLAISQNGGTTSETISRTYTAGTYFVRVYGFNNANNATTCYTLRVATGTATVNEMPLVVNDKIKLVMAPNPANDKLTIYTANYYNQKVLELFDINGRRVYMGKDAETATTLNVSKLAKGLYLLKVSTPDGILLAQDKFVKE